MLTTHNRYGEVITILRALATFGSKDKSLASHRNSHVAFGRVPGFSLLPELQVHCKDP